MEVPTRIVATFSPDHTISKGLTPGTDIFIVTNRQFIVFFPTMAEAVARCLSGCGWGTHAVTPAEEE